MIFAQAEQNRCKIVIQGAHHVAQAKQVKRAITKSPTCHVCAYGYFFLGGGNSLFISQLPQSLICGHLEEM